MIKITVNRVLRRTTLLLLTLFGLAACTPVVLPGLPGLAIQLPQGYSVQPPRMVRTPVQRPQQRQNVQLIPQAGALTTAPVAVARGRAAQVRPPPRVVPAGRQLQRQTAQVAVPPRLNPVPQARRTDVNQNANSHYRPSASVARAPARNRQPIWENSARTVTPTRRKAAPVRRPSAAVRKPTASVASKKTRVASRVNKSVKSANSTKQAQAQKPEVAEIEVLDLSGSLAKNTNAETTQEKKTASVALSPRSYNSSPAVAVLTKQANNQLTVGKAGRAAATLERALRIEPDNPLLWLRLAEVNAQQGKKSQAASMARKALNLAPGDAGLQARGQRLLN